VILAEKVNSFTSLLPKALEYTSDEYEFSVEMDEVIP
jgi:hypothetical protein